MKHRGTFHFLAQCLSAMGLLVLAPWFVFSAAQNLPDPDRITVLVFLTDPLNAIGVLLLCLFALYHMHLGVQSVLDDYIAKPASRAALKALSLVASLAAAAASISAVYQTQIGG